MVLCELQLDIDFDACDSEIWKDTLMRLLLVEDHLSFAMYIKKELAKEGFTVDCVGTISDGEVAVKTVDYDAMILDRGLPDGDGLNLVRELRENGDATPILILTARDSVDDRVEGLASGSDDYLLKPFAMKELVARIRALLRRPKNDLGLSLTVGNIALDPSSRQVSVEGVTIRCPRRETGILENLLRSKGRYISKDALQDKVYGFGEEVTSNAVELQVSRLRKRLKDAGADVHIINQRGVGYCLGDDS
mgnify:FL=1